jgi:hypothetical protein
LLTIKLVKEFLALNRNWSFSTLFSKFQHWILFLIWIPRT